MSTKASARVEEVGAAVPTAPWDITGLEDEDSSKTDKTKAARGDGSAGPNHADGPPLAPGGVAGIAWEGVDFVASPLVDASTDPPPATPVVVQIEGMQPPEHPSQQPSAAALSQYNTGTFVRLEDIPVADAVTTREDEAKDLCCELKIRGLQLGGKARLALLAVVLVVVGTLLGVLLPKRGSGATALPEATTITPPAVDLPSAQPSEGESPKVTSDAPSTQPNEGPRTEATISTPPALDFPSTQPSEGKGSGSGAASDTPPTQPTDGPRTEVTISMPPAVDLSSTQPSEGEGSEATSDAPSTQPTEVLRTEVTTSMPQAVDFPSTQPPEGEGSGAASDTPSTQPTEGPSTDRSAPLGTDLQPTQPPTPQAGCGKWITLGEPLGGGKDYGRTVSTADIALGADADLSDLTSALGVVRNGQSIFIHGDARIDFGSTRDLVIPTGVTLASSRGVEGSPGALLRTSILGGTLLRTGGDGVRLTGLRLEGPSQTTEELVPTTGVGCTHDNFEVDNCELYGFTAAAISLWGPVHASVSYNNIHHNRRSGEGYGILLGGPWATDDGRVDVFGNVFNANRHSVAGSGRQNQTYVAHHNLVLWTANGGVFNMHGECEPSEPIYDSPWAGGWIEVARNFILVTSHSSIDIRGSPSIGSRIEHNFLAKNSGAIEVYRVNRSDRYCEEMKDEPIVNYDANSPVYNCYEASLWLVGLSATDHYQLLGISSYTADNLGFGDFDADGKTDVFRTSGGTWYISWGGRSSWDPINGSVFSLTSFLFGDFDGDGSTDVFCKDGSRWLVSWSGKSLWDEVEQSNIDISKLRLGDFNGDGRTDIFVLGSGTWLVSFAKENREGMSKWQTTRSFPSSGGAASGGSGNSISNLRFGDFDGDGATDVFLADGGKWYVAYGDKGCAISSGTGCQFSGWDEINSSSYRVGSLAFGDVDGDNKTDVLSLSRGRFAVSYGGRGRWQPRGEAPPVSGIRNLVFRDFNGDGADDVFFSHQDN